jgi:hypothetical protein
MKIFSPLGGVSVAIKSRRLLVGIKQQIKKTANINTKKLSSLQRKLMTKNDTSKTANMKWDGGV